MNNKNTKDNILHKIMVLLVVFSLTVIDTVPLWVNAIAVTKEEVPTEGLQEGNKEEELVEEELVEEELVEEELEEELVEEELLEEELLEEELVEEELTEEELVEEELVKTDKETNLGRGLLTTTFGTKLKSNLTNTNEDMVARTMATTSTYKMATDADFSGTTDGSFRYIGTDEYVEIPHRIKGVNVTSYNNMFRDTSVKGVKSTNKNVTNMRYMFYNSKATSLDLSNFDTSNVTDMIYMFYGSKATRLDLSSFNTSRVTDMRYMFSDSQATSLDLSSFNTSSVPSMRSMFSNSQATRLDLSNFDTSKVTDMSSMFSGSQATSLDLSSFDTSSVTMMSSMFNNSQATSLDLSNFDTSNVTSMWNMFRNSQATSLNLRSFDTRRVTDMSTMFEGSQSTSLDLSSFDTSSVTNTNNMFRNSKVTVGYTRTQADANKFNGSSNKPTSLTFYVVTIPPNYVLATDSDFSGTSNGSFRYIGTDEYVVIPPVIKGVSITSYNNMFNGTSVKGVASTNKNVTNMQYMFSQSQATSLDLSNLDTSEVTNMSRMFYNSKATSIDLRNFDTSNVTNMSYMFYGTQETSLDLRNFDTSKVTSMSYMFAQSKAQDLDLSSFDTSSVTNMSWMFYGSQATRLDLSNFDTSKVTTMYQMFRDSKATSFNLSSFNTSSVTNMSWMFRGSQATTLDLSSFDTSRVTNMGNMFQNSQASIGYARTQADADSFNGSSDKPSGLTFYVYEEDVPTGTITGNPTSWTNQNITLRFNATDASGVKRVQKPDGTWVNGSSTTHTVTTNGTYTFKAEDNIGNTGTYSVSVNRIDKTLPTVSFGTNGNSTARQSHSTTVSVADSGGSGVATRQYQWTTSTATPTSGTWTSFTSGATITRNTGTGNIYLHIRATDGAGNVRNSRSNAFNMDNTAPTTPTLTASTTAWTNGNVTVTGTYSTDSTVKQYRIGSGAWTNYTAPFTVSANATVYARGQDSAGNWSTERSLAISNIDKTLPNGTISASTTAHTSGNVTLTFSATDTGGSGVRRVRVSGGTWVNGSTTTQVASSNGTYSFEVEDNAGNTRTVSHTVSNIDKTIPTVSLSTNGGGYAQTHSTVISATDNLSGVNTIQYSWTTNTTFPTSGLTTVTSGTTVSTPTTEGNHYLHVRATDKVGNVRNFTSNVFRVDRTAPTHVSNTVTGQRYTSGTNYWVRPNDVLTVTFRKQDTLSGNQSGYIRLLGNSQDVRYIHLFTGTATNMTPVNSTFVNTSSIEVQSVNRTEHDTTTGYGTTQWKVKLNTTGHNYELQYYHRDNASNSRGYTTVGRVRVDGVAPTVTLTPNTTGHTNQNVTITATASDADSGVKRIQRPDGTWVNGSTTTHTVTSNGTYSFVVEDNVGNQRTQTISVSNIDKTLPTGTITGNPTSWVNSNQTLTFTATDTGGSGVRRVRVSGGTWVNGATTTQVATQNGTYAFEVEDNAGNTREVSVVVNRIDKTLPNGTITGNPTTWTNSNQTLTFTATDTGGSGVSRVRNHSGTWTSGTTTSQTVSSNGTYTFRVEDGAGNIRDVSVVVDKIDKTSPTVTFGTNGSSTASNSHSTTVSVSDSGSGVSTRQYQWTTSTATPTSGTWTSFTNGATITRNTGNGNHYLHIRSTDVAGNTVNTRSNAFNLDTTAPTAPTLSASTTAWTNGNVTVTVTYPTDASVKQYKIGSGSWLTYTTPVAISSNSTVYARGQDSAGNWSNEGSLAISNIDKTVPNGTIAGNPTTWTNSNQVLTFTATDSGGSGVRRVRIKDGTWVDGSTTTQTATANGTYTFTVEDNAGNTRDVSVTVNRIDKTLPNGTITGNPTSWTSSDATLTFNATDTGGSGVSRVRRPDGTWVTGETTSQTVTSNGTYTFRAEDGAGNTRDVSVVVNRIDKTLPTVSFGTNGNSTASQSHSTTVSISDSGSGIASSQYQWTSSTATPTSGTWTSFTNGATITRNTGTGNIYLHVRVTDNVGNVRNIRTNAFNMDNTPPTVPTLSASTTGWTNGNVAVTITYPSDATVKQYKLGSSGTWTNYTTPLTVTSNNTVYARAQDSAGNWSNEGSLAISNIDKTVPNGTITGNPTTWVNSNQTLTFNATDSGGSGVRRVRVKDGAWDNGATTTQVATQNGTYAFEVEDNAGNTREVSVVVNRIDKTLPNGTISGNPTTWVNSNQTLTFTATDTGGSGVRRVRVKDGSWVSGATTTLTVSTNGTYVFEVEDNAGNTREVSVVVNRIDKTLPTVTLGTNGNSTPRKSQSTTVNVTDTGSGVSTRQYQWTTSATFPTSGTWSNFANGETITRNSGTGNYYLHIRATDVVGNVRQVTSNVFNVDNTAPIAPTYTPSTTGWTNGNVTVTINYPTDANIKEYRVGSGAWGIYTSTVTLTNNNSIFARAFDLAGNESSTSSLNVTNIDKVAPVLNITGNPTDWTEEDEITLAVTTSDSLSGVRRITLPDNKVVTSSNATYKVVENGDYVFKVEDNAGNITTRTVTVDKLMVHYYLYIFDSKGNPVSGAKFELVRDGEVYRTVTSESNGYLDFGKVPPVGKYTLRQVTNSDGIEIKDPVEIDQDVSDPIEEDNPIEYPVGETIEGAILTVNPNTWTNKDVKVTINYSTDSTIKQYKVNDGEWEEYKTPITLSENSTVYARAYDDVGNWSPETSLEITTIDKAIPTISIEINTEDWVSDKVELTVIAKDDASGVQTTTSTQDLERISQDTQGDTVRSTYLVKDNGSYEFTVTDKTGNTVLDTYTVNNIDKTVPEITVNGNPTDWFRDYELELEVITSDTQSGVKQVTLPDGTVVTGQELDTLTYKVTDNGSYEFIVEDNVGNKTTYTEEVTMLEKEFSVKVTDTGNKPLTGAEFELYRDGELIETVVSDSSGLVEFGTVYTSGDYEIRQTRVPEGYRLNNNIQEVDVADDDINITNYHQSEVLPSTGTRDALILLVMGLASITVITVTNKKRRKLSKEV